MFSIFYKSSSEPWFRLKTEFVGTARETKITGVMVSYTSHFRDVRFMRQHCHFLMYTQSLHIIIVQIVKMGIFSPDRPTFPDYQLAEQIFFSLN